MRRNKIVIIILSVILIVGLFRYASTKLYGNKVPIAPKVSVQTNIDLKAAQKEFENGQIDEKQLKEIQEQFKNELNAQDVLAPGREKARQSIREIQEFRKTAKGQQMQDLKSIGIE